MPTSNTLQDHNEEVSFFDMVYQVVRLIPEGRVTSYGAIGSYLGAARSARMVGWAMNNAHHLDPPVPAHRVVNRAGQLTGRAHFNPPERMQELLEAEGVNVTEHQIVHFDTVFWNPSVELSL